MLVRRGTDAIGPVNDGERVLASEVRNRICSLIPICSCTLGIVVSIRREAYGGTF